MREVDAYQTSDGKLFTNEISAKEHEENLLGEALDALVPNDDRGNITRVDKFNLLLKMIKDPKLERKIDAVHKILHHRDEEFKP